MFTQESSIGCVQHAEIQQTSRAWIEKEKEKQRQRKQIRNCNAFGVLCCCRKNVKCILNRNKLGEALKGVGEIAGKEIHIDKRFTSNGYWIQAKRYR